MNPHHLVFMKNFPEGLDPDWGKAGAMFGGVSRSGAIFPELILTFSNSMKYLTHHLLKRCIPKCSKSLTKDFLRNCQWMTWARNLP